jgi:formate/nitrite transporter FocA (FNT family)
MPNDEIRREADRVQEHSTPPTPVIYDVVRRLGVEEMERPAVSLWWSGLAAGLSMSFSLFAEAILLSHLPDADWRHLVVALGYPVGFVMVVLSRQQLFTENTITVVLPVMAEPSGYHFKCAARMWGIVLIANVVGTLLAALLIAHTPVVTPELREAMLDVSREAMPAGALEGLFHGITAGFLMAALVWLMPAAEGAQFFVVYLMAYLIGASGSAHIVAGSVESFMLVLNGELGVGEMLGEFTGPVLVGNIIGGTALFAVLAHAQVAKEI